MGSIRNQMLVYLLAGVAIIGLAMGGVLAIQLVRLPAQVHRQTQAITSAAASDVSSKLQGFVQQVEMVANSAIMDSMDPARIQQFLPSFVTDPTFLNMTAVWPDGSGWRTVGDWINVREQEQFDEIIVQGNALHISQPFFSPFVEDETPIAIISAAVKREGQTIGLANAVIPVDFLDEIAAEIMVERSGFGWIINSEGMIVAHPKGGVSGREFIEDWLPATVVERISSNEARSPQHFVDSVGRHTLLYFEEIPGTPGWVFLVQVPREEILGVIDGVLRWVTTTFAAAFVLVGLFGYVYSQRLSQPIVEMTHVFAQAAAGDLSVRADETIPNEIGEAGAGFNHMLDIVEDLTYGDTVTGLCNYQGFLQQAPMLAQNAWSHGQAVGVAIISIDDFKRINSLSGYDTGNQVLRQMSVLLRGYVEEGELAARHYGDEFVVLLVDRDEETATTRTGDLVGHCQTQIAVGEQVFSLDLSVGAAIGTLTASLPLLIKQATIARQKAKQLGGRNCQFYNDSMGEAMLLENQMEHALEEALEKNHDEPGSLQLAYQPILTTCSRSVHGVEALLRWYHPEFGHVSPVQVIRLAEQKGLILRIGQWVLRKACEQGVEWFAMGFEPFIVSVNVSMLQLEQPHFAQQVQDILAQTGMPAQYLELEITESHAMADVENKLIILRELKELGVRIAIDDFGTGYSSLAYVTQLPMDTLKIDRAFILHLYEDPHAASVVNTIITLAQSIDVDVTAEGVETDTQWEYLQSKGCTNIQGFLIARPMTAQDCTIFLQTNQPKGV